jgi:hypothetical protein
MLIGCDSEDNFKNESAEIEDSSDLLLKADIGRGNTIGNIINNGKVAQKDNWIYYTYQDDELLNTYNIKGHIYRINTDGSNREKITEDDSEYLNVLDDWIYYCNWDDDGKLYKVRTDGTCRMKINEDKSLYINVLGDWIYYSNWDDDGKIYRVRTDGTEKMIINDEESIFLNVINDWIFYINFENEFIYKVRTDGSGLTMVNNERSSYINVVDDWIYYQNRNDQHTLYKIKIDGTNRSRLTDQSAYFINVVDDWIYYTNNMDGWTIFKVSTNGEEDTRIVDDSVRGGLNAVDGWIYYLNSSDNFKLYRIRPDGTQRHPFGGEETHYAANVDIDHENHQYYVSVAQDNHLFIRKSPGVSNKKQDDILDRVPRGRLLVLKDDHNDDLFVDNLIWWEVSDPVTEVSGWVAANYLVASELELENESHVNKLIADYSGEQNLRGNSTGNIANGGYSVYYDGWIYFHYNLGCVSADYCGSIAKVRPDGSGFEIVDYRPHPIYINIQDGWIYYCNPDIDGNIFKVRIDGSEYIELNDDYSEYLNIVGEWIYYIGNNDEGGFIYKIDKWGANLTRLSEDSAVSSINVVGDWIYYVNRIGDSSIYKMRTDGSQRTKLNISPGKYLNVADGWIYYTNSDDRDRIYKMLIDGSKNQRVGKDRAQSIIVDENWIYYKNRDDANAIYRISVDGRFRRKVTDHDVGYITGTGWFNLAGGRLIIYNSGNSDEGLYIMNTDGSELLSIE